jgi:uncharacterized protein with NRDE domain
VCTLIAIHRGVQGSPLIVAANRDEYYDRPAEGPAIRRLGGRRILAPLDLRAGGTWLGINQEAVFAAVTNLRDESPDPARRSRGWIVMDALREPTAARAADMLKALPEETYNPFQCLVADGEKAFRLVYRERPRLEELAPGTHVIGNLDPVEEAAPKVERIRARVAGIEKLEGHRALTELARVCAEHEPGGVAGTCVHLDGGKAYGTRSSILFELQEKRRGRLWVADGAPCQIEYEDQTALLEALGMGEKQVGNRS